MFWKLLNCFWTADIGNDYCLATLPRKYLGTIALNLGFAVMSQMSNGNFSCFCGFNPDNFRVFGEIVIPKLKR
jgi:hypothetical protein